MCPLERQESLKPHLVVAFIDLLNVLEVTNVSPEILLIGINLTLARAFP